MSEMIRNAANELREFLFSRVYFAGLEEAETTHAHQVIISLYNYYINNPARLPEEYARNNDSIERQVADYIAGMTDHYAILTAEQISPSADI